jgi:hypothetical protein
MVSPATGLIPVKQKPASLAASVGPPPSPPDDDPEEDPEDEPDEDPDDDPEDDPDEDPDDDPEDDPDEDPDPPSAALVALTVQAAMFAELAAAATSVAVPESTHIFFVEIIGTTSLERVEPSRR